MKLKDLISKLKEDIKENKKVLNHKNIIIVGDNCSGKSTLLKKIITNNGKEYFIDSTNRKLVSDSKEITIEFKNLNIEDIVAIRLDKKNFNKKDVFNEITKTELVVSELRKNIESYKELFKKIFSMELREELEELEEGESFNIRIETENNQVKNTVLQSIKNNDDSLIIDGSRMDELSDGTQAKLRLLMEINFAIEKKCEIIYIDEFDLSFDTEKISENIKKILDYYNNKNLRFVLTTHSPYAIRDLENFDIIKINRNYETIEENLCEIFDGNDFNNLEIIDKKLFFRNNKEESSKVDIFLSNSIKKIISRQELTTEELEKLEKLEKLSLKQKFIKSFILKEYSKES